MTNNTNIGIKKSNFTESSNIPANATFDYVNNGQNFKVTFNDFIVQAGLSLNLLQTGNPAGTPVLDIQGADNFIRNLAGSNGISASIDGFNGINISTNFTFDSTGASLVPNAAADNLAFKSIVGGTNITVTDSSNIIDVSLDSAVTDQVDDLQTNVDVLSRTGIIENTAFAVSKINDTTIEIASGNGQILDDGSLTDFTLSSATQITTTGDNLFSSGQGFISIAPYEVGDVDQAPSAGNSFVGKKVVGTEATIYWTRYLPVNRGIIYTDDRKGINLTKIFFVGTTLLLSGRPWSYKDEGNANAVNLRGNPGYNHTIEYTGSGAVFDMSEDGFAVRRTVCPIGEETFVTPQTDDVFLGIYKDFTKTTRGLPIRFHLYNLLDSSGQSNDYIPNADVISGGTYEQWWRYIDDTFNQVPSSSLTPTLVGSTTDWVFVDFAYFAGSGNIIGIWGTQTIDNADIDAVVNSEFLRLNPRTKDVTPLFTLLVQCTNTATISNYIVYPAKKFNLDQ